MGTLTFTEKHTDVMWSNWLLQFEGKKKLEAYHKALAAPLDDLDTVLSDLLYKRGIDTAQGVQLDNVGYIVGQPRYVSGAFFLPFFGYTGQPAAKGYGQARYRRMGESSEDTLSTIGDAEYRSLIKWKVIANAAGGTVEDVIAAMRALFTDATRVVVRNTAVREITVLVYTKGVPNPAFAENIEAYVPRAAGVRVIARVAREDREG